MDGEGLLSNLLMMKSSALCPTPVGLLRGVHHSDLDGVPPLEFLHW